MLYKIIHNLCYFLSHIITPRPNVSQRTDRRLLIHQPFARTNTFMYSFVPRSVRVWKSLPEQIVTAPIRPFRNSVTQYLDLQLNISSVFPLYLLVILLGYTLY